MTLEVVKHWKCNPCGVVSTEEHPRGWTWLRSGGRIHHRCPDCELKAAPEHRGVPLGKVSEGK